MKRLLAVLVIALPLGTGCTSNTITKDHTPAPEHRLSGLAQTQMANINNSIDQGTYILLNANTTRPPYDTIGDAWSKGWATTNYTVDYWFADYDWREAATEDY